jgi:hypothetical protein
MVSIRGEGFLHVLAHHLRHVGGLRHRRAYLEGFERQAVASRGILAEVAGGHQGLRQVVGAGLGKVQRLGDVVELQSFGVVGQKLQHGQSPRQGRLDFSQAPSVHK